MLERHYQAHLITKLRERFDGCMILKNDSSYLQGVPDLLILYDSYWAALEVKTSEVFVPEPNQEWYIQLMDHMSFAAFIYPSNEEEVLNALEFSFSTVRETRFP